VIRNIKNEDFDDTRAYTQYATYCDTIMEIALTEDNSKYYQQAFNELAHKKGETDSKDPIIELLSKFIKESILKGYRYLSADLYKSNRVLRNRIRKNNIYDKPTLIRSNRETNATVGIREMKAEIGSVLYQTYDIKTIEIMMDPLGISRAHREYVYDYYQKKIKEIGKNRGIFQGYSYDPILMKFAEFVKHCISEGCTFTDYTFYPISCNTSSPIMCIKLCQLDLYKHNSILSNIEDF